MTDQTLDLDAIEARARAATQGDWYIHCPEGDKRCLSIFGEDSANDLVCDLYSELEDEDGWEIYPDASANAGHIAGMDPATTLALTAEVRKLREAMAADEGKIWSAIKNGLTMGHTSMRNICNAQTFEMASAHEDELARAIADRVTQALKAPQS